MDEPLIALAGDSEILAPAVGLWRNAPGPGALVSPGDHIGDLEVLGVVRRLVAPEGVHGIVIAVIRDRVRVPVAYGDRLLTLDARASAGEAAVSRTDQAVGAGGGLALRSPSSGRFYRRPAPDKPAFVSDGDEVAVGQTVCLLEVMKTFNRVTYGGPGLPERARVVRVVPADEADIASGDAILELEAL